MLGAWVTIIILGLAFYFATRKMKMIPSGLQGLAEWIIEALLNFCKSIVGEKNGQRFFAIVATIFLFIIANAWLGQVPLYNAIYFVTEEGFHAPLVRPANGDINLTLALALISFIFVEFIAFKSQGLGYLNKFFNVKKVGRGIKELFQGKIKQGLGNFANGFIEFFVGLLELLSEIIRIVSLTFRLFGNMTAGEILIIITSFLIPFILGVPFYGMELLFGFVQALVFAGLTLVFLSMSVERHHEE